MNDDALAERLATLVKLSTERHMRDGGIETVLGVYDAVIAQVERPMLTAVLAHVHGNQSQAARVLGINRNTLRKKMRMHGLLSR